LIAASVSTDTLQNISGSCTQSVWLLPIFFTLSVSIMSRHVSFLFAAMLWLVAACSTPRSVTTTSTATSAVATYTVAIPNVAAEQFQVVATIKGITTDTTTYFFPIWGPGAYDLVYFGKYVRNFTATGANGEPLKVRQMDSSSFLISGINGVVNLRYEVKDIENVPNSAWFGLSDIEPNLAFANTPALFGYAAGYKEIPHTVTYARPQGWDITLGLDPIAGQPDSYAARDYDELVDAPVHMGKFQRLEFMVDGKPHIISINAPEPLSKLDMQSLRDTAQRVVRIVSNLFGELPYKRYIFQVFLADMDEASVSAFGALEHANSSTYRMPFVKGAVAQSLAEVLAHEYWHLWSPKRIHVAELGPFNYQRGPRTRSLWFAEGLTEYYAQALLARNGMVSPEKIIADINQAAESFGVRRQREAITDLSLRVAEAPLFEIIGLYSKGPMIGFLLDAEIRLQTGNRKSLDDAMRFFNEKYGKTGMTFGDDDIIPAIEQATGTKLSDFYSRYIAGREPLPFAEYLPRLGFTPVTTYDTTATFGATFSADEKGWMVEDITPNGAAAAMGLQKGDILTEVQGGDNQFSLTSIPPQFADMLASQLPPGLTVSLLRNGVGKQAEILVKTAIVEQKQWGLDSNGGGLGAQIRRVMIGA
jgi:predicted metalloprotease with PDZ domain